MRFAGKLQRRYDRWLDPALAVVLLIAFEIEILNSPHRHGPIALNVLLVVAMTVPLAWRRRWPLAFGCTVMGSALVASAALTDAVKLIVPLYALFIPAYTVAAYEPRNRALLGLAVCLLGPWGMLAMANPKIGDFAFTAGMSGASWATGRALRSRRALAAELTRKAERIAAERDVRERLAVADERTRIARELQALVANSVSAMVVQSELAQRLLERDPAAADAAMEAVEDTGREAMSEMRRILGVLRHAGGEAELAPQPGVGQVHTLVEERRRLGRQIELRADGDPGPLPAVVDLAVYRILEEALESAVEPVQVALRFDESSVELGVITSGTPDWPTLAMRERVALCDGRVDLQPARGGGHRLTARLPRAYEQVLA